MGKKSGPAPDERIGEAALMSAQTGQDYLGMMKQQAEVANAWAAEDRTRYKSVMEPLQDAFIARSKAGPDYGKVEGDVRRSVADVAMNFSAAQGQNDRRLAAAGVRPDSGRGMAATRSSELAEAAARTGAANTTRLTSRRSAEAEAAAREASAINMGSGGQVNPATSLGMASGALTAGANGAMRGYQQQGNLLNTQWQQQQQAHQNKMAGMGSLMGGLGNIAGLGLSIFSDEDMKENKKPAKSVLKAVKGMRVDKWSYKDDAGTGDTAEHMGTYAQDFKKQTGLGDGRKISVIDALGVNLAAVKELAEKVDKLEGKAA